MKKKIQFFMEIDNKWMIGLSRRQRTRKLNKMKQIVI